MKNKRLNILFCDFPIIELIISDYWKARFDIQVDDLSSSQNWYSLISKYSELVLDIDESEFIELAESNQIANQLKKNSLTGGAKIIFWKDHPSIMEKENRYEDFPNALFLLSRTETYCKRKIDEYGFLFMNINSYKSYADRLFLPRILLINKNNNWSDISSWHDLKESVLPANSLILTDNYIAKHNSDIKNNLIQLLDAIIPDKLEKFDFQLMIITDEMPENDLIKRYSEIQNHIDTRLARPFKIILTLLTTNKTKNHDRRIFTNYYLYESGNSFTYFDETSNVQKDTTLSIFPSSMSVSGLELMLDKKFKILEWVKVLVEENCRKKMPVESHINNRLLALKHS